MKRKILLGVTVLVCAAAVAFASIGGNAKKTDGQCVKASKCCAGQNACSASLP